MGQRVLPRGLVRTWRFLIGGDRLMRKRYIASGSMVYHGLEFGR